MSSIIVYSVFTAACGLSRTLAELAAFRFLLGLGMGGEWATGAALVAETWRPEHRGKALGLMQSGFAAGYALAAAIAAIILPRWGWRAVFFAGILPALLTLWIRHGVQESPLWLAKSRSSGFVSQGSPSEDSSSQNSDFQSQRSKRYLKMISIALLMNSAAMFAWWGLFTWIPAYLALPAAKGGRGLTIVASSVWIAVMQAGMWLGYVSFGFLSDALGRKRTYVGYLLIAATLVPLYAGTKAVGSLLALGPLIAFFGTGHFTGFGISTAELFPTSFRAFAMGLTYNFGRALSAAAPWAIGSIAEHRGLGSAFLMSSVAYVMAALLALALPETRRRALS